VDAAHPAIARPVRYGVVGSGRPGCEHILAIRALEREGLARLVAVSESDPRHRSWALECLGGDVAAIDLAVDHGDLLGRPDLDAVVVSSGTAREELLDLALRTDHAVMVEAPVAFSLEAATFAAERADERWAGRGALTWVAADQRRSPAVARFLASVSSAAGELRMLSVRDHRGGDGGEHRLGRHGCRDSTRELLTRWAPLLDTLHGAVGDRPLRVNASGLALDPDGDGSSILGGVALVEYRHGVVASLELCAFDGRDPWVSQGWRAVGTRATVEADGAGLRVWPHADVSPFELPARPHGAVAVPARPGLVSEHRAFVTAICEERPTESSVCDHLASIATAAAMRTSIEQRRSVALGELRDDCCERH
jgi:predicted dehydrogenase